MCLQFQQDGSLYCENRNEILSHTRLSYCRDCVILSLKLQFHLKSARILKHETKPPFSLE